jgi:hypothetical protein
MTSSQGLRFIKEILSEVEGIIKHAEKIATELGVVDSIVYDDILDELEVLKESLLDKIEEYEE